MSIHNTSVSKLMCSFDPEAAWIGGMFLQQKETILRALEDEGLTREEGELAIELFCERLLASVSEEMNPLPFPNYWDELIEELKGQVLAYKEAC